MQAKECVPTEKFAGRQLGSALKILLVDDDPLQASVRKSIFERKFADVQRVANAAEAFCLVEEPQFARNLGLVVSGNHLNGLGRREFVAELHTRMPKLPILVLGGLREEIGQFAEGNIRIMARPYGADEMLAVASGMVTQSEQMTA